MDVYQYAMDKVDPENRSKYIEDTFEKVMKNLKKFVICRELDIKTNSMTYVFEHIKEALVEIISTFIQPSQREYLNSKKWNDVQYRKFLLDTLVSLKYRPIILWMFLYTNYYNHTNLDDQRRQLLENIDMLKNYYPSKMYFSKIDDLYWACPLTNVLFSISYQNRNNRLIMENYSLMLRQICPDINYNGIQMQNRRKNTKPRILFLSEFLTMDSSVLRDRMGVMTKLPSAKFDVYYASYTDQTQIVDNISKQVLSLFDNRYINLSDDFDENRKKLLQYNFDVIVYCELGMRMRPYYLAHSRLAPIQVTTWGHSETSGINTVDYYISSKYFEHETAQNHYVEKLVQFNSLSTYYYPPSQILTPNYTYLTRKDLQLDNNVNLYGCIQTSFKISEALEDMMCNILDKDKNGYIMLSRAKPFCESQISRMYNKFGDKFNRLIFYPGLPITTYLNMVKLMDVMLDPFPFGGCNTSFEAFDFNVPVVTLPTKYINGRFTYGLYRKMGFIDMIATNTENYVKIAVKCATDKQWRQSVSDKIASNKHLIFMEEDSVYEWSDFLSSKISEHKLD